jgi:hypothetical protein
MADTPPFYHGTKPLKPILPHVRDVLSSLPESSPLLICIAGDGAGNCAINLEELFEERGLARSPAHRGFSTACGLLPSGEFKGNRPAGGGANCGSRVRLSARPIVSCSRLGCRSASGDRQSPRLSDEGLVVDHWPG